MELVKSYDELLKVVPQLDNKQRHPDASKHYVAVDTAKVVKGFMNLGWQPRQAFSKKGSWGHHMIKLEHESDLRVGDDIIQIVIQNSYDRTSKFQLNAGVFRVVCQNGMIIPKENLGMASIEQRHMGFDPQEFYTMVNEVMESVSKVGNVIGSMKAKILSTPEKIDFARKTSLLRVDESVAETINFEEILEPSRPEDQYDDLWTVSNLLQEKMIRGGVTYVTDKDRSRRMRKLSNYKREVEITEGIMKHAFEYLN